MIGGSRPSGSLLGGDVHAAVPGDLGDAGAVAHAHQQVGHEALEVSALQLARERRHDEVPGLVLDALGTHHIDRDRLGVVWIDRHRRRCHRLRAREEVKELLEVLLDLKDRDRRAHLEARGL